MSRAGGPSIDLPDPPLADVPAGVLLRPWSDTADDAAALVSAWSDPAIVAAHRVPADTSLAAAARWLRGEPDRRARGVALDLVIAPAAGGPTVLGEVGLRTIDQGRRRAEISWWVAAEHRRGGLASAASRLVADWALSDRVGLLQVWCRIAPGNLASSSVATAAGFVELGTAEGMAVWARAVPGGTRERPAPSE